MSGIAFIIVPSVLVAVAVVVWKMLEPNRFPLWFMLVPVANLTFFPFLVILVALQPKTIEERWEKTLRKGIIYTEAELARFDSGLE